MYSQTINKKTKCVLEKIEKGNILKDFYLAGGTSLAIQLGHRESIDLDFFSKKHFSVFKKQKEISLLGKFILDYKDRNTLDGVLDGVKVSFFYYDYRLLYPCVKLKKINLADKRDIACMKIDAISSRGSKKDFIDFYFLLQEYNLPQLILFFEKKYKEIKFNKLHILKSLTYFDDAEGEPMPVMIKKVLWKQVKEKIKQEVKIMAD
ncbi:MAG: nucleotidyl transferase AbiEii/AbiGii toxin family protein [Patescibacteria group bacterium]|nr:nucleotidyl transferase AbiEii/AbiGii toxin family protein [Patescibacteria group bacterium]